MADNTASDVRSVISNATRLKPDNSRNPVMRGLQGKNDTIATKEEIQASKWLESSPLTAKSAVANFRKNTGVAQTTPNFKASDYQTSTQKTAQEKMMSTPEDKVSSDTVVNRGAMRTGIEATGYSDPNQINDSWTQIAWVEIQGPQGNAINAEQEANKPTVWERFWPTGIGRYQQKQEAALEERKINMGNTLTNLYATVNDRLNNRWLYTSLEDVRQYIPELNEYNDATVNQIISDMTYLSQQGGNDTQNLLSLFEAYWLDAELQFEQLDDVTKGEYLAYLANAGREEQAPWWMDYIANIFVNRDLDLDRNMTLGEFLESTSEEAQKGKVKTRQLKWAQVADYRNLLNKYAEYYTVTDQKALNSRFDTYLKWQNKELSAKEAADKWDNIWYERWGIQDMIQWKDKEKEKEFKKEYNKLLGEKEKGLIKNVGQNALIWATNLASWMYSFFNNLLTIDTTNGVKIASPSAKGVIQLWLWTAINTYENITGKEQAGDTIKELGNSMEANWGWAGKFLNWIIQNSEESASFLWNDYIVPNYWSVEKFMDSLTDAPVNTISAVVTVWELSTRLAGKVWIWGKTYKLDPKTWTVMYDRKGNPIQVSKLSLVADDIAKLDPATWMWAAYWKVGETALKVTTAPVKWTFKILGKWASKLIDNIASKATGLSKEQRDFIRDNPELVQDFLKWDRTADDLIKEIEDKYGSEKAAKIAEGRIFELLKKDQTPLDTRGMLYKIQDAFGELGVVIDKAGKIQFTKPIEDSVKARITKAYEYINSIANWSAKAGDVHWAREGIGWLTKWDQWHTMTAQESMMNNAMKTVYNGIGEVLKTQVKGWAEADAEYSRIINVLNDFDLNVKCNEDTYVEDTFAYSGTVAKQKDGKAFDPTGLTFSIDRASGTGISVPVSEISFNPEILSETDKFVVATHIKSTQTIQIPVDVSGIEDTYNITSKATQYKDKATPSDIKNLTNNSDNFEFNIIEGEVRFYANPSSGDVGTTSDIVLCDSTSLTLYAPETFAISRVEINCSSKNKNNTKYGPADVSVGGTVVTSIGRESRTKIVDYTFNQSVTISTTKWIYIEYIKVTIVKSTNVDHMASAYAFDFNEITTAECSAMKGISDTVWTKCSNIYDFAVIENPELILKLKEASAEQTGDDLGQALYRYDLIVSKYGKNDFMSRNPSSANGVNQLISINNIQDTTWIIVIVGLVSLTAVGGYIFIRRRKED